MTDERERLREVLWKHGIRSDKHADEILDDLLALPTQAQEGVAWVVEAEGPPGKWTQIGPACPSDAAADDVAAFHRRVTGERTRVTSAPTEEEEQ